MIHWCGPCTSGIVTTAGGGPRKLSFFYTSSQGHVSCPPLLDCGQKTSAPGHPVAQGLKKRHRDSEGRKTQVSCRCGTLPSPGLWMGSLVGISDPLLMAMGVLMCPAQAPSQCLQLCSAARGGKAGREAGVHLGLRPSCPLRMRTSVC